MINSAPDHGFMIGVCVRERDIQNKRHGRSCNVVNSCRTDSLFCMCLILPCIVSVDAGAAVAQGQRPEHFRVRSFPIRHACCSSLHYNTNSHQYTRQHTQTHTRAGGTEKGTQRWSKMSYCREIDQIFMRGRTARLNSNRGFAPECALRPLPAHKVGNSYPKDNA